MASDLRTLALKADAALAAFLAAAEADGKLWPDETRTLNGALGVVRQHERSRRG